MELTHFIATKYGQKCEIRRHRSQIFVNVHWSVQKIFTLTNSLNNKKLKFDKWIDDLDKV